MKSDELSDVHANRPFGKVFQAIRSVERYLAPVFQEAGPKPFAHQSQAYTKRSTIDRIIELHGLAYPTGQIAAAVRLSGATVSRLIVAHENKLQETTEN